MGLLAIFGIESDGVNLAINLLILSLVVTWFALIYWTFADARRRIADPMLVGCATASALFPFVGTVIYSIVRPPEYLDDVRERELEIAAAQARLSNSGHDLCPFCHNAIERAFLRCPSCMRKLKDPCRTCGRPLDPRWSICPYCEAEVGQSRQQPSRPPREPRRERPPSRAEVDGAGIPQSPDERVAGRAAVAPEPSVAASQRSREAGPPVRPRDPAPAVRPRAEVPPTRDPAPAVRSRAEVPPTRDQGPAVRPRAQPPGARDPRPAVRPRDQRPLRASAPSPREGDLRDTSPSLREGDLRHSSPSPREGEPARSASGPRAPRSPGDRDLAGSSPPSPRDGDLSRGSGPAPREPRPPRDGGRPTAPRPRP